MDSIDVYRKLDELAKNDMAILDKIGDVRVSQASTRIQLEGMSKDVAKNTIDVSLHIKRTDQLEGVVDKLKGFLIALSVLSPLAAGLLTFITQQLLSK